MWKLLAFIVSSLLLVVVALPVDQSTIIDAKPIILEAVDLPTENAVVVELKPTVEEKPAELAFDAITDESNEPQPSGSLSNGDASSESIPSGSLPSGLALGESAPSGVPPSSSTARPTVTTFVEAIPFNPAAPPRRQVHYDQRQEGKFNIRADLDNFVILVVPSSGASLLDLLKRSNSKSHHNKRTHSKGHKKYYSKNSSTVKSHDKTVQESNRLDYLRPEPVELIARPIRDEFIEGRTPYHVDISSAEISPAAPTSIADLPLSNVNPSIVGPTVYLPTSIQGNAYARNFDLLPSTSGLAIYPRHRKSLTNDDQSINTNSVLLTPLPNTNNHNNQHAINTIVDDDDNTGYGDLIKPKPATPILTGPDFFSLNVASIDPLAVVVHDDDDDTTKLAATTTTTSTSTSTHDINNSRLELTLLGAQEQCGPDRRRDSYGVCQFVPQDYAT